MPRGRRRISRRHRYGSYGLTGQVVATPPPDPTPKLLRSGSYGTIEYTEADNTVTVTVKSGDIKLISMRFYRFYADQMAQWSQIDSLLKAAFTAGTLRDQQANEASKVKRHIE